MPTAPVCPDIAQYEKLATGELSVPDKDALLDHLESCHASENVNGIAGLNQ